VSSDSEEGSGSLSKIEEALHWAYERATTGLAHLSSATELGDQYMRDNSGNRAAAIESLISWSSAEAGGAGFLTGLGGVATLPLAVPANLASALYIQLRMVAAIAYICSYDVRSHQVKTLAIACLCGDSVAEPFKTAGISVGSRLAANAINQISGATIRSINRTVGMRLLTKAGSTGVVNLSKLVPVIGGIVSGGFDAAATYTIGKTAQNLFYGTKPSEHPDAPASVNGTP
jgi:hypothetical protein